MAIKLGLIGFGAVGSAVAEAIQEGKAGDARLVQVLVRSPQKHAQDDGSRTWRLTADPDAFFSEPMDLVVETAGHEALRQYAVRALRSGRDLLTISAGAFAEDDLLQQIREEAAASGRRVLIPSGAIGGLDAITSAAVGGLKEVTIITRKPPRAWKGTVAERRVDLSGLTEPVCLYAGPAREAAKLYPQNVNVQATLALAGIGLDATRSAVYADPSVHHNTHEIAARGAFGEIRITISNLASEASAKTGKIVAMSVIKAIRNLTSSFVVGI